MINNYGVSRVSNRQVDALCGSFALFIGNTRIRNGNLSVEKRFFTDKSLPNVVLSVKLALFTDKSLS